MRKNLKIIWERSALDELKEILSYIEKQSIAGARIVNTAIREGVKTLKTNPNTYTADFLKDNNDGSYRAFTVYSYRITYKIANNEIIILRVRHTSREPLEH